MHDVGFVYSLLCALTSNITVLEPRGFPCDARRRCTLATVCHPPTFPEHVFIQRLRHTKARREKMHRRPPPSRLQYNKNIMRTSRLFGNSWIMQSHGHAYGERQRL